jgi:hypothetical protein
MGFMGFKKGENMKNKIGDLNNHLFAALERLNDEGEDKLKGEDLKEELERAKAISGIAKDILQVGHLQLRAIKTQQEYGLGKGGSGFLQIEDKSDE